MDPADREILRLAIATVAMHGIVIGLRMLGGEEEISGFSFRIADALLSEHDRTREK